MKAKKSASQSKNKKIGVAKATKKSSTKKMEKKILPESWHLRLYVAGQTPKSLTAFCNLKQLCEAHLPGRYEIEVIDLTKQPHRAQGDQIVALPTLVRHLPEPIKRIVGDLSNIERVLVGMELNPVK